MDDKFDVIGVDIETNEVRLIAENKTQRNAEAIEEMAVAGRGVDDEFFCMVKAGEYNDGDTWKGE